ncbi:MAG: hypothetical protein FWH17_04415 [Oscillospiraceae bacterium]|nr:hypothetical protein [Oscillospiraceae bacterium]
MVIIESRLPKIFGVVVDGFSVDIANRLKKWVVPFWNTDCLSDYINILTIVPVSTGNEVGYRVGVCYIDSNNSVDKIVSLILHHTRIIFKLCAMQYGYVNLHSACISYNDIGILIDAPRNNGKTTVLLEALSTGDFLLIANDQVMLNHNNMISYGYPATVGLRTSSLSHKLQSKVIRYENDPYVNGKKPIVHIVDIADEFDATICPQAQIKVLVNYSKANNYNELHVKTSFVNGREKLKSMEFPLTTAYRSEVVEYYLGRVSEVVHPIFCKENHDYTLLLIDVSCGIKQIPNLLEKIKTSIMELS